MINFDQVLGVHEQALYLRSQRSSLLATNLANADTPGFQARDINFEQVLADKAGHLSKQSRADAGFKLRASDADHINGQMRIDKPTALSYRIPFQASLDGNTVESHVENAEFAENLVRYQASLRFLSGKFASMKYALNEGK